MKKLSSALNELMFKVKALFSPKSSKVKAKVLSLTKKQSKHFKKKNKKSRK